MALQHAHPRLCNALGCIIGFHLVAWAAPSLGETAMAAAGAQALVPVPASASGQLPAASNVGCGAKGGALQGVALQVLGSGGPELQDKRASSSYLIWRAGVPRVLIDSGGGDVCRRPAVLSGVTLTTAASIASTACADSGPIAAHFPTQEYVQPPPWVGGARQTSPSGLLRDA